MNEVLHNKVQEFKNLLMANGQAQNTVKNYIPRVVKFLETNNVSDLAQINTTMILEYFSKLAGVYQQTTMNGHIEAVSQFCEFHKLTGLTFPRQEIAVSKRIKRPITEEELGKLIEPQIEHLFPNPLEVKALIYFMFYTGLRKSEVVAVQKTDCQFVNHELQLFIPKQKIIRRVPFAENLEILLDKYFSTSTPSKNAFNTSEDKIDNIIKVLKDKEVLGPDRKIWPHLFRDSFACHCLKNGITLPELKEFMGHKRVEETMKYLTLCPLEMNKEFRKKIKGIK